MNSMGQDETKGPPKKKLKQAQLTFFNSPKSVSKPPLSNKRKVVDSCSDDEIQVNKVICKSPRGVVDVEKENVDCNKTTYDVLKHVDNEKSCEKSLTNDGLEIKDKSSQIESEVISIDEDCDVESSHIPKLEDRQNKNDTDSRQSNKKESWDRSLVTEIKTNIADDEELATPLDESCTNKDDLLNESNLKLSHGSSSESLEKSITELSEEDNINVSSDVARKESSGSEDEASMLATPSSTISPKTPNRKLTPKQLKRREESLKKKEEKERLKLEKQAEKNRLLEEKQKLKAEEEEKKKKQREERKKKQLAEIEQKNEEKRLKIEEKKLRKEKEEEEKRLKAEEKLKKKEEKRKEEEAKEEEKKKKSEAKLIEQKKEEQAKEAFVSFFKKSNRDSEANTPGKKDVQEEMKFMPFPMKNDMRLAVVNRRQLRENEKKVLDKFVAEETESPENDLYLQNLKSGNYQIKTSDATWPVSAWQEEQHDVIIVESIGDDTGMKLDEPIIDSHKSKNHRAKLLQFCENRRPAYWGTWRKKTKSITPRRPFSLDKDLIDYEVDSDSEWEDEEEGESLEDDEKERSDDEEEVNGENGYVLDKQFVPHGYLSDEEAPEENDEDISPEAQKLRLTVLKEEFDEEMKQKAERLKPRLLGCVWISNGTTEVAKGSLYASLFQYRCVWDEEKGPLELSGDPICDSPQSGALSSSKIKPFPPNVLETLVKMVHGSHLPHLQLVKEFNEILITDFPGVNIPKIQISRKIKELATKVHDNIGKQVWSVNSEMRSNYNLKGIEEMTPTHTTPQTPVEKAKDTFLETFLKGKTNPPVAKKRISLTPVDRKGNQVTPPNPTPKIDLVKKKKKVPFTTLPKTPQQNGDGCRPSLHKDTPRPTTNIFLDNKPYLDLTEDSN